MSNDTLFRTVISENPTSENFPLTFKNNAVNMLGKVDPGLARYLTQFLKTENFLDSAGRLLSESRASSPINCLPENVSPREILPGFSLTGEYRSLVEGLPAREKVMGAGIA